MKTYLLELCRGHDEGALIPTINFYFILKNEIIISNGPIELMKLLDSQIKEVIQNLNLDISSEEWLYEQFDLQWHQTSGKYGEIWDYLECEHEDFYIVYRYSSLFGSSLDRLCRIDINDFYDKYGTDLQNKIDLERYDF